MPKLDLEVPFGTGGFRSESVCRVLRFFSRFEWALKRAGFAKMRGRQISIRRRSFAREHSGAKLPHPLTGGLAYLILHPPKQQVLEDDALVWQDMPEAPEPPTLEWLLDAAYVVRNNLFHGGKTISRPARDNQLLQAAEDVLRLALECDENVRRYYEEPI